MYVEFQSIDDLKTALGQNKTDVQLKPCMHMFRSSFYLDSDNWG
jgi:hypothetical protein